MPSLSAEMPISTEVPAERLGPIVSAASIPIIVSVLFILVNPM